MSRRPTPGTTNARGTPPVPHQILSPAPPPPPPDQPPPRLPFHPRQPPTNLQRNLACFPQSNEPPAKSSATAALRPRRRIEESSRGPSRTQSSTQRSRDKFPRPLELETLHSNAAGREKEIVKQNFLYENLHPRFQTHSPSLDALWLR
ncbi:hypothetical protein JYU34_006098 [Plutella xylostella]|uniref:Uncharacterized protein n=1 Tax=Plutella xylostella TaxID=51655 RepID=A0ABQ7QUY6_PLUXY|nr:hypothetical protein JYU34_006098 [Plutella xylostella]